MGEMCAVRGAILVTVDGVGAFIWEMCAVRVAILVTVDALMREMCAVRGAILVLEPSRPSHVSRVDSMGGGRGRGPGHEII